MSGFGRTARARRPALHAALGAAAIVAVLVGRPAGAAAPCEHADAGIPRRTAQETSGRDFARQIADLAGELRDALVVRELLAGNLPDRLRHFAAVELEGRARSGEPVELTFCVMPDYLAVGSDADGLLVPMGLPAALEIAERFGFVLPTPALVDAIYDAAVVKLEPEPLPAGDAMRSTAYVVRHDLLIARQRETFDAPEDALTAGHKKDLVFTDRLLDMPGRVAIYGWHRASHAPIQPLSTVHGAQYADYSHGVRLVSRTVFVNGVRRGLAEVLGDPELRRLLDGAGRAFDLGPHGLLSVLQQRKPR